LSELPARQRQVSGMMGDQADGLRRLFAAPAVTLAVAAREAAVIDAYTLIKRVVQEEGRSCFRITITHARTSEEAQAVFDNMRRVAHEYLGVRLEYVGMSAPPAAPGAAFPGPAGVALLDSVL
jgi:MinD-like ATPase involved in chromosome partitioning or flagellar assembly